MGKGMVSWSFTKTFQVLSPKNSSVVAICKSKTSAPDGGHCATQGDHKHGQGSGVLDLHRIFHILTPKNGKVTAIHKSETSTSDGGHCATPGDPGHVQGHGVMDLH